MAGLCDNVSTMTSIGFLHTAEVHVATFDELTRQEAPATDSLHVVDESLLDRARVHGIDSVAADVEARLDELRDRGAGVIVCTCSTIGGLAEQVAGDASTFRVDRPMARAAVAAVAAVAAGRRIGVIVALESTFEPTEALLREEALAAGVDPVIELVLAEGAWTEFEAGNTEAYLQRIAETARALADRVAVVVLAQASMAAVEPALADLSVPVLSSPSAAVSYAITQLRSQCD